MIALILILVGSYQPMASMAHSVFLDRKTEELYSPLIDLKDPSNQSDYQLIRNAQHITRVNSHCPNQDITHLLDNCFIYQGVGLKGAETSPLPIRNRSYTIIKATQSTKKPIGEDQLKRRLSKSHTEYIYSYDRNVSLSNRVPAPMSPFPQQIPQITTKISTITLDNSPFTDAIRTPRVPQNKILLYSGQLNNSLHTTNIKKRKAKVNDSLLRDRQIKVRCSNSRERTERDVNPIVEVEQGMHLKYTFKSMRKRVTGNWRGNGGRSNLFSCADEPIRMIQQGKQRTCFCRQNEIVAAKIDSNSWNK